MGGSIAYSVIPKTLDLQITAMTGSGIGRYGSGQLPDVTIRPNGTLAPIQETTASFWAPPGMSRRCWTSTPMPARKPSCRNTSMLGTPPPIWASAIPAVVNTGCATENGQPARSISQAENQINGGFWWRIYQGKFGSFRFGGSIPTPSCISFAGSTGAHAPTDDSMFFTSIRYYPF